MLYYILYNPLQQSSVVFSLIYRITESIKTLTQLVTADLNQALKTCQMFMISLKLMNQDPYLKHILLIGMFCLFDRFLLLF